MSDNNEDRMDVEVVGVKLGTASGWDSADTNNLQFYDFTPEEQYRTKLHMFKDINIALDTGIITDHDENGEIAFATTFLEVIGHGA